MNSEVDIVDYDVIRMDCSKWGGGVACYITKKLWYNHKTSSCPKIETIFIDICLPKANFGGCVILASC